MNKKGFTLVELIGVVVILGIIIGIAVPSYIAVSNNIRSKNYDQKIDNIKAKALEYANDNNVESITIPVKALIEEGYLAEENPDNSDNEKITNPLGGYLDCINIDIVRVDDSYEISISDTKNCSTENIVNNDKINIEVYEYRNNQIGNKLGTNGNVSWTNSDKVLLYADVSKLEGIGSDTTWNYGTLSKKKSGNIATSPTVDEAYANIYVVEALVFLNSEYTFSISTNSGVATQKVDVKIDREKPSANASVSSEWTKENNKDVLISGSDGNGSGVKSYYIGDNDNVSNTEVFNLEYENDTKKDYLSVPLDVGTYYLYAIDNAGNISNSYKFTVSGIDKNGPVCKYPTGNTTWTNQNVVLTYGCNNDLGTGCAENQEQTTTIDFTAKTYPLKYTIKDNLGNETICERTIDVFVDKTAPTIKFNNNDEYIWETTKNNIEDYYKYTESISGATISCNYTNTKDLPFGKNNVTCTITGGSGLTNSSSTIFHHRYTASQACSGGRYLSGNDCKMDYQNNASQCGCRTWNECATWSCGSYNKTCATAACGVDSYKSCAIPACGPASYNTCQHASCGTTAGYYKKTSCKSYRWNCVRAGMSGSYVTYGPSNPYPGHCSRGDCVDYNKSYVPGTTKTCATPACGVASYKTCQHSDCGVASYKTCQHSDCGQAPNTCRNSDCGCETGNDCTKIENNYHYYYCHRTGNTGGKGDLNGSTCTFN